MRAESASKPHHAGSFSHPQGHSSPTHLTVPASSHSPRPRSHSGNVVQQLHIQRSERQNSASQSASPKAPVPHYHYTNSNRPSPSPSPQPSARSSPTTSRHASPHATPPQTPQLDREERRGMIRFQDLLEQHAIQQQQLSQQRRLPVQDPQPHPIQLNLPQKHIQPSSRHISHQPNGYHQNDTSPQPSSPPSPHRGHHRRRSSSPPSQLSPSSAAAHTPLGHKSGFVRLGSAGDKRSPHHTSSPANAGLSKRSPLHLSHPHSSDAQRFWQDHDDVKRDHESRGMPATPEANALPASAPVLPTFRIDAPAKVLSATRVQEREREKERERERERERDRQAQRVAYALQPTMMHANSAQPSNSSSSTLSLPSSNPAVQHAHSMPTSLTASPANPAPRALPPTASASVPSSPPLPSHTLSVDAPDITNLSFFRPPPLQLPTNGSSTNLSGSNAAATPVGMIPFPSAPPSLFNARTHGSSFSGQAANGSGPIRSSSSLVLPSSMHALSSSSTRTPVGASQSYSQSLSPHTSPTGSAAASARSSPRASPRLRKSVRFVEDRSRMQASYSANALLNLQQQQQQQQAAQRGYSANPNMGNLRKDRSASLSSLSTVASDPTFTHCLRSFHNLHAVEQQLLHSLQAGAYLLKFNSEGKPQKRWVWLNWDGTQLNWAERRKSHYHGHAQQSSSSRYADDMMIMEGERALRARRGWSWTIGKWKVNPHRARCLIECSGLHYGPYYSSNFKRLLSAHQQAPNGAAKEFPAPWLCFSLQFVDRTIDLACVDESQVNTWFLGLQCCVPLSVYYLSRATLFWQRLIMKMNSMGMDRITKLINGSSDGRSKKKKKQHLT